MKYYSEVEMTLETYHRTTKNDMLGQVHSIFKSTINIISNHNSLITLADTSFKNAPNLFRIAGFKPHLLDLKEGMEVIIKNKQLLINGVLLIDYNHAVLATFEKNIFPKSTEHFSLKIHQIRQADWYQTKRETYQQQPFMRLIRDTIQEQAALLKANGLHQKPQIMANVLKRFIGLGIGLTPSGDDFLCGLATVVALEHYPNQRLRCGLESLQPVLKEATNIISSQQFSMALQGEVRREIAITLQAICSELPYEAVEAEIQNILSIGSTSGFDILEGMLVGLELALSKEEHMELNVRILKNRYFDSVSLMSMSSKANQIDGVEEAMVGMATDMNKEVMKNVGLYNDDIDQALTSDLVISTKIKTGFDQEKILNEIETLIFEKKEISDEETASLTYNTIDDAAHHVKDANLALISVNGAYAAREVRQALNNDLNVMLFSDNVSIEAEKELKELAHEKGLLMMGPDCGTAIINNVGLGFANKVRQGNIGIVGASGTGSQEVSVRIHEFGGGVSQLLGTGGRDLSVEIGGRTMLDAIDLLEADSNTDVILLVSKTPDQEVADVIIEKAQGLSKPVVIWFVGSTEAKTEGNIHFETMSKDAALKAVELSGVTMTVASEKAADEALVQKVRAELKPEQKYIRGLFAGGTLCGEAVAIVEAKYDNVYSNVTKDPEHQLVDLHKSKENTFIDFGADEYTDGKPHPMIDPSNRVDRFLQEAKDPEVGVIVLDFVLGYGAHEDPVGMMVPHIKKAIADAKAEGRTLEVLGYILGTDLDKQNLDKQIKELQNSGAMLAGSSQDTGLLAREFIHK